MNKDIKFKLWMWKDLIQWNILNPTLKDEAFSFEHPCCAYAKAQAENDGVGREKKCAYCPLEWPDFTNGEYPSDIDPCIKSYRGLQQMLLIIIRRTDDPQRRKKLINAMKDIMEKSKGMKLKKGVSYESEERITPYFYYGKNREVEDCSLLSGKLHRGF